MVYKYSWKGMVQPVSAEEVAMHLQELEKRHGSITKENFLDSARDEASKFHRLFNWNDTDAAEKYRLYQASRIIASISVTAVEDEQNTVATRMFVMPGHSEHKGGSYISIQKAMSNDDIRSRVLEDARREAKWFVDKYKNLEAFSEVIDAINHVLDATA